MKCCSTLGSKTVREIVEPEPILSINKILINILIISHCQSILEEI